MPDATVLIAHSARLAARLLSPPVVAKQEAIVLEALCRHGGINFSWRALVVGYPTPPV